MSDIWKDAPEGATHIGSSGNFFKEIDGKFAFFTCGVQHGGWLIDNQSQPNRLNLTPRPEAKPEELTLLEENTRQYKISNIGNILHNMSCFTDDENEQNELGGYASFMWDLADWFRDSAAGCSKDKPVYTQADCDANKLIKKLLEAANDITTLHTYEDCYDVASEMLDLIKEYETPPIELIDGKAYQFDYTQGVKVINNISGICIESGNIFLTVDGSFCVPNCTNITLLTPEVKS